MALLVTSGQDSFVPMPPPAKRPSSEIPFASAVPIPAAAEEQVSDRLLSMLALPPCHDYEPHPSTDATMHHALDDVTLDILKQQGFSLGLANSLSVVKQNFAKRIFIIDNSGSMQRNDGHRMVDNKHRGTVKIVPCSRWEEVRESINYHIRMTGLVKAPTSFRLLNHPGATVGTQLFGVAELNCSPERIAEDVEQGLYIMGRTQPAGCTPLTDHMQTIFNEVREAAPMLRANGQRISVTICTDGLPSDPYGRGGPEHNRAFVDSLRQLEDLPVWIVIRLCTDEDEVVDFYNNLDGQLEVSIEVLDDLLGEAQEVHQVNPWLNYGLPLHRLRELGFHDRVLDMLDERALTLTELLDFCGLLFGRDKMDGVPDPSADWAGFRNAVDQIVRTESLHWVSEESPCCLPNYCLFYNSP